MSLDFDQLLKHYENGHISRRRLLGTLTAAVVAPVSAQGQPEIGKAEQLNHVTIFAQSVSRSTEFYQKLFGMPVLTRQEPGVNLNTQSGFLGIYPAPPGAAGSIHHFCLGLGSFDAEVTQQMLADRGVESQIRLRGNTNELYLKDPDGISVQLQDSRYRGGTGPLGDRDPE